MGLHKIMYKMENPVGKRPSRDCLFYLQHLGKPSLEQNTYRQLIRGIRYVAQMQENTTLQQIDLDNFNYTVQFVSVYTENAGHVYRCYLCGRTPEGARKKIYLVNQLACDIVHLERELDKKNIYPYHLPKSGNMSAKWKVRKQLAEALFECRITRNRVIYCNTSKAERKRCSFRRIYHNKESLKVYPNLPDQMRLMLWTERYLLTCNPAVRTKRSRFRKVLIRKSQDT